MLASRKGHLTRRGWVRGDTVASLLQSPQSSACGGGYGPSDGSRLPEPHTEELSSGTDPDASQLVRRWKSDFAGFGTLERDPNPETYPPLCSFNIQMCVGATGHNIPQKLREWHGGRVGRREV